MKRITGFIAFFLLVTLISCNSNTPDNTLQQQKVNKTDTVAVPVKVKTIIFFGNSLTAGYGVDPSEAFPALIQQKIDSLQLGFKVINAGVSGETSAGGSSRISWILRQPVNLFVLELGGNDGLRGIPLTETSKNLQSIIDRVKAKYPEAKIVLAGMQIPPSMGRKYATDFRQLFYDLAANNHITLIPFLLEGVGGEAKLNQQDGIHPTPEGHKIVAETVWNVLKKESVFTIK